MANKKKAETPVTNSNVNTNTQNVHVHVNEIKKPRTPRKTPAKKSKPNWVTKAVVVGIIGLTLSILGYYIKITYFGSSHAPATVHANTPQ